MKYGVRRTVTVMEDAFLEITGKQGGVSAEYPRLKEHFGMSKDEYREELRKARDDPSIGIINLADAWDAMCETEEQLMSGYAGSWERWRRRNN